MKKRPAKASIRKHHAPHFYVIFGVVTFFVGVFVTLVFTKVLAQTNEVIYACVNKVGGNIRIVKADETCSKNEESLSWNQQGPQGPQGEPGSSDEGRNLPYSCYNCFLFPFADKFRGSNFTNAQIQRSEFQGADLTGVIFKGAFLSSTSFRNTNLTDADFSNLSEQYLNNGFYYSSNLNFNNANLTSANFSNSILHEFDFRSANLQNTNFSNTLIRGSKFQGAQNGSTANFTGATWENTTCPDGTNSNNNGNTCEGHL